ncbi:hypothetical protein Trydic_g8970 [Trypoxylus dichotomus]
MSKYCVTIFIVAFNLITKGVRAEKTDVNTTNWCKLKCKAMKNICCIYDTNDFGRLCEGRAQTIEYHADDRIEMVGIHNKFRYILAKGNFDYPGLNGTQAANMHVLSYSKQLEFSAGCWARQCRLHRSRCRSVEDGRVGEIVCYEDHIDVDDDMLHDIGIRMLEFCLQHKVRQSSVKYTHNNIDSLVLPLTGDDVINREAVQSMWATTRYVGCTRVKFPHTKPNYMIYLQVCHYYPRGNVLKKSIFIRGEPGSKCPADGGVNMQYSALCGDIRPLEFDNWQAKGHRNTLGVILSLYLLYLLRYALQ